MARPGSQNNRGMMPRDLASGELNKEPEPADRIRSVVIPFIIFTAIWGSTWIVIRDQLGVVAPQWSVTYRFVIAATAMAGIARGLIKRESGDRASATIVEGQSDFQS